MVPSDFNALVSSSKQSPNPSNQIFHHKLIRALSLYNEVDVIVNRPLPKSKGFFHNLPYEKKKEGNITFHYVGFNNSRWFKYFSFRNRANLLVSKLFLEKKDTILMVDSLNVALAKVARFASALHHVPNVGIITDHPGNLSGVSKKYVEAIFASFKFYDVFLTLTEDLNTLANPQKKPHYVFPGLVEEVKVPKTMTQRPFMFFGGALYERYGVLNLLNAFTTYTKDCDLIIAGQGPVSLKVREAAKRDPRIIYVGMLTPADVLKYQKNSILNINPRPNDSEIDRYSIPSKMLDYMGSGVPTLSVRNDELYALAGETILWAKSGSADDLRDALEVFSNMDSDSKEKLSMEAKKRVFERYALDIQGSKISYFIKSNK